jgi:hypothetical protein
MRDQPLQALAVEHAVFVERRGQCRHDTGWQELRHRRLLLGVHIAC